MEQTLLLNATYEPLKVVHWQKAMTLWCQGKVEVISVYDREVRSVSFSFKLPSVIRLLRYIKIKRQHRLRAVLPGQHLRPGRPLVPVLRSGLSHSGADVRPCRAGRPGRPKGLGEHRDLLHQLQPPEGWPDAGEAGMHLTRMPRRPDKAPAIRITVGLRTPPTAGGTTSTGTWSSTRADAVPAPLDGGDRHFSASATTVNQTVSPHVSHFLRPALPRCVRSGRSKAGA